MRQWPTSPPARTTSCAHNQRRRSMKTLTKLATVTLLAMSAAAPAFAFEPEAQILTERSMSAVGQNQAYGAYAQEIDRAGVHHRTGSATARRAQQLYVDRSYVGRHSPPIIKERVALLFGSNGKEAAWTRRPLFYSRSRRRRRRLRRTCRGSACISCRSRKGMIRCGRPCPSSRDPSDCARLASRCRYRPASAPAPVPAHPRR